MAYTGHGYHIPNTNRGEGVTRAVTPTGCGGPQAGCPRCKKDVEDYMESVKGTQENFQERAKGIVRKYVKASIPPEGDANFDVYVPWFSKTLQNWKSTVGTTRNDGLYFEVTYDGEKRRTYVDVYRKIDHFIIQDDI
uniref:Uncharacterized protein n=1 Tax=Streptomyces phage Scarif TaxID=3158858 RepID=A0AAU7GYI3_9CAUD